MQDLEGKKIDLQPQHSGCDVESASYTFEKEDEFKPKISIFTIQFVPIKVGSTEFEITTSAVTE